MSLTNLIHRVVDGLWALGGIGAAADLGLEGFGDWDTPCPCPARACDAKPAAERKA